MDMVCLKTWQPFKSHVYEDFHVFCQLRERAIWLIQLNSLPKTAKNVYGNFHVYNAWTKAADNLDHQVSIEISIHLLKQRICIIHFLPKESIEISMRCFNFFWTNVADILYTEVSTEIFM